MRIPTSAIPRPVKRAVRSAVDWSGVVLGRRDVLTPPARLTAYVGGSFEETGHEFLGYMVELAGLRPTDSVLDIGSGIGRLAVPMTRYLRDGGTYRGFDIVPSGIEWCVANVSKRFPNFAFQLADIRNDRYNPDGAARASEYVFPYASASFDVAVAVSVFTHMLPADVENYVSEAARVLKPRGCFLMTAFLMNDDARAGLAANVTSVRFPFDRGDHLVQSEDVPGEAVAYPEDAFRAMLSSRGLQVAEPIRFGCWSGRDDCTTFQDLIVANCA